MKMSLNKWCFVPGCANTSKNSPQKIFISVPRDLTKKKKWFAAARRELKAVSLKTVFFCCEDHFNLTEDMENYCEYKLSKVQARMKPNVVPHIFFCQADKKPNNSRLSSELRSRKRIISEFFNESNKSLQENLIDDSPIINSEESTSFDLAGEIKIATVKMDFSYQDAWEENDGKEVRKDIKSEPDTDNFESQEMKPTHTNILEKVKIEPEDDDYKAIKVELRDNDAIRIKIEPQDNNMEHKIKREPQDSTDKKNAFNDTLEEGEIRDSVCSSHEPNKRLLCKTPPTPLHANIKPDPDERVDAMFDESPYNKELFNSLKIKEETPIKTEDEESISSTRNTLKSAKRSVFNRHSPYKRIDSDVGTEKRVSAKTRLGPKEDIPRKKIREDIEADPEVIARREKQIEYGKNTLAYDRYITLVPREERKQGDPQTPDKHKKYSRRGFDGLIKHWRLKLHKYDP